MAMALPASAVLVGDEHDLQANLLGQRHGRFGVDQQQVDAAIGDVQGALVGALVAEDLVGRRQPATDQCFLDPLLLHGAGLGADAVAGGVLALFHRDGGIRFAQEGILGRAVGDAEIDRLVALGRGLHGGDHGVDLAFLHGGDQRVKRHILDFDLDAQLFADGARQVHVVTRQICRRHRSIHRAGSRPRCQRRWCPSP